MNNIGIYIITNKINNHCYIGSAINLKRRKENHFKNHKGKSNPRLQNAMRKYGKENFKFEILEYILNKKDLLKREQYYLDVFKPEYNICKKAGSMLGFKFSKESKLKMSKNKIGHKYNLGRKKSEETRQKISEKNKGKTPWNKGIFCYIDTRKKISNSLKGYKHTEEAKRNMSKNNPKYWAGKHHTEKTKGEISKTQTGKYKGINHPNYKGKIICINTNKVYISAKEASKCLKISQGNLSSILNGIRKTTNGLKFSYLTEI